MEYSDKSLCEMSIEYLTEFHSSESEYYAVKTDYVFQ